MQFALFDAAVGGSQIGATILATRLTPLLVTLQF
jgi:hypothetical protein